MPALLLTLYVSVTKLLPMGSRLAMDMTAVTLEGSSRRRGLGCIFRRYSDLSVGNIVVPSCETPVGHLGTEFVPTTPGFWSLLPCL
jgi:hypothetical protein